jgi:hypothetical protein
LASESNLLYPVLECLKNHQALTITAHRRIPTDSLAAAMAQRWQVTRY